MNALKAFVVVISMLFFATTATAASVVTVSVVPGQFVGLNSAGYFAGIFKLNVDGKEYLAMNDIAWFDALFPLPWYSDGTSWQANLYTQDDILGGALVVFSPSLYSKAAPFFLQGLLGYNPADPLWTASFNEMVMNTLGNGTVPPLWDYSNQIYDQQTGVQLIDVYNNMLPTLDGNFNYRGSVTF